MPPPRHLQDELNQMLGQSLSDADDEAVAAEMAALEDEGMLAEKAALPKVPTTPVATTVQQKPAETLVQDKEEVEGRREAPMLAS